MSGEGAAPFVPADDAVRRAAAEDLSRSWSIEAGAGTGKTTLLVGRILAHLRAGAPIEGIGAITFTTLAAAELSVRLREKIDERRREAEAVGDRELADLWRRAEAGLDAARISTIHSFCASILRRYPAEAGIDPRFRGDGEEGTGSALLERSKARWRAEIFSADPETATGRAVARALAFGARVSEFDEIAEALARAVGLGELVANPSPAPLIDPRRMVESMREEVEALAARLDPARERGDKLAEALAVELPRFRAKLDRPLEEFLLWLHGEDDPVDVSVGAGSAKLWPGGKADVDAAKDFVRSTRRAAKGKGETGAWRRTIDAAVAASIVEPLRPVMQRFLAIHAEEKARDGVLDFGDLLLAARDLLRRNPDVRREIAEGFTALLVDEFQDTDPVQVEIVEAIAGLGEGHRPGSLFLVGDPKQSIYRFRRADIVSYQRARERLLGEGSARSGEGSLVANFRSHGRILEWVEAALGPVFRLAADRSGAARQAGWQSLVPREPVASGDPPRVSLLVRGEGWEGEVRAEELRRAEASAAAGWIAGHLDAGLPIRTKEGEVRPLRPADVAILLRALSDVAIVEEALRARGLPYRIEGGKSFFLRQEVAAAIHALVALENPREELSVVAALRSPLFSLTAAQLLVARRALGRLDPSHPERDLRLPAGDAVGDSLRLLAQLRRHRDEQPLAATLEELLDRTALRESLLLRRDAARPLGNLAALVAAARDPSEARPPTFGEQVERLRRRLDDQDEAAEAPAGDDDDGRVQLMSMHKAKGLEFPVVLLLDLDRKPAVVRRERVFAAGAGDGVPPSAVEVRLGKFGSAGWAGADEREAAAERTEQARLLYVAATRARERLVVSLLSAKAAPNDGSLLSLLAEGRVLDPMTRPGAFPVPLELVPVPASAGIPPAPDEPATGDAAEVERAMETFLRERAARGREPGAVFVAPPSAEPDDEADLPSAERRSDDDGAGRRFGTLVHRLMERLPLDLSGPADPRLARLARAISAEEGTGGDDEAARVVAHARRAVAGGIWRRIVAALRVHRELEIGVGGEEGGRDGKIDLLAEEQDGGWLVVDWKSDAGGWEAAAAERRAHYAEQIRAYREMLGAMPRGGRRMSLVLVFTATGEEIAVD